MNDSLQEFIKITDEYLPLAQKFGFKIEKLGDGSCVVRAEFSQDFLRPGGTVAGPVLMALADYAVYGAIISRAGSMVHAVTSNLNINFLRRPGPGDIMASATLIRLGKRLAVGVVELRSDAETEMVAHATCTYSLPLQEYTTEMTNG